MGNEISYSIYARQRRVCVWRGEKKNNTSDKAVKYRLRQSATILSRFCRR